MTKKKKNTEKCFYIESLDFLNKTPISIFSYFFFEMRFLACILFLKFYYFKVRF